MLQPAREKRNDFCTVSKTVKKGVRHMTHDTANRVETADLNFTTKTFVGMGREGGMEREREREREGGRNKTETGHFCKQQDI